MHSGLFVRAGYTQAKEGVVGEKHPRFRGAVDMKKGLTL